MRKRIFLNFKRTYFLTENANAAVCVVFIYFLCFYFYHRKVDICGAVIPNTKRMCPFLRTSSKLVREMECPLFARQEVSAAEYACHQHSHHQRRQNY